MIVALCDLFCQTMEELSLVQIKRGIAIIQRVQTGIIKQFKPKSDTTFRGLVKEEYLIIVNQLFMNTYIVGTH